MDLYGHLVEWYKERPQVGIICLDSEKLTSRIKKLYIYKPQVETFQLFRFFYYFFLLF